MFDFWDYSRTNRMTHGPAGGSIDMTDFEAKTNPYRSTSETGSVVGNGKSGFVSGSY